MKLLNIFSDYAGLDLKERDSPTFDGQIFKVIRQF